MKSPPENLTLLEHTRLLLRAQTKALTTLARESGISYAWLYAVRQEIIRNPGVKQLEKLHAFLLKKC